MATAVYYSGGTSNSYGYTWVNPASSPAGEANKVLNMMYTMLCLQFGLDTPEERHIFGSFLRNVSGEWTPEYTYEYLIDKAYWVKHGRHEAN